MPSPSFGNLRTIGVSGTGYNAESTEERLLTVCAMLASGQNPDGTPAAASTFNVLHVQAFGAVGNGVTDDTLAIIATFNAAAAQVATGGEPCVCFCPPSVFYSVGGYVPVAGGPGGTVATPGVNCLPFLVPSGTHVYTPSGWNTVNTLIVLAAPAVLPQKTTDGFTWTGRSAIFCSTSYATQTAVAVDTGIHFENLALTGNCYTQNGNLSIATNATSSAGGGSTFNYTPANNTKTGMALFDVTTPSAVGQNVTITRSGSQATTSSTTTVTNGDLLIMSNTMYAAALSNTVPTITVSAGVAALLQVGMQVVDLSNPTNLCAVGDIVVVSSIAGTTITLANPANGGWTHPLVASTDTLLFYPRWDGIVLNGNEHVVEHIYSNNMPGSGVVLTSGNQALNTGINASQENHLVRNKFIWPSFNPQLAFNVHQHGIWIQKIGATGVTDSFVNHCIPSRMADNGIQLDSGGNIVLTENHPWSINGMAAVHWQTMSGSAMHDTVVDATGNQQANTAVGAASNNVDVSAFSGTQTLTVASVAPAGNPLLQSGVVACSVNAGAAYAWLSYGSVGVDGSGNPALLNCTYLNGIPQITGAATVTTGSAVSQVYATIFANSVSAPPGQQPSIITGTKHHPNTSGSGTLCGLYIAGSSTLAELTLDHNRWTEDSGSSFLNDYAYVFAGSASGFIINKGPGEVNRCSTPTPQILSGAVSLSSSAVYQAVNTPTTVTNCTTNNSNGIVTTTSSFAGVYVGQSVTGTGVGASATVQSIQSTTQITLSVTGTANGTNSITFSLHTGAANRFLTSTILTPGDYWMSASAILLGTSSVSACDLFVIGSSSGGATTSPVRLGTSFMTQATTTNPNYATFAGKMTVTASGTVDLAIFPAAGMTGTTQMVVGSQAGGSALNNSYLSWQRA